MLKNFSFKTSLLTPLFSILALSTWTADSQAQSSKNPSKWNAPFAKSSDYRTWSIGLHGGILSQANVFDIGTQYPNYYYEAGYGAFVRKQILPAFALQADFLTGKVSGWEDADYFETELKWSGALSAHFTLGNINWRHRDGFLKPYINIGFGYMGYKPYNYIDDEEHFWLLTNGMFIPAGAGLKVKILPELNLNLGYTMNFARTKAFDGIPSDFRDAFSYAHGGLEFTFGPKTKPVLANTNPVAEMYYAQQAQYDSLYEEMQQQKAAFEKREQNLITENEKVKNQIERLYGDLADEDGDGVANRYDQCPGTPKGVKVDGAGCPLPNAPAPIIQQIIVTEEDRKVVDEAIKNLEFDLGEATIRPTSYASLNKVAILLIEKKFSLKLAGHTDNTGPGDLNMRLSKSRAEAVKAYLVSKGAQSSRIEATGYGHTQPIASNQTEEGRQQNRRVEFTLY